MSKNIKQKDDVTQIRKLGDVCDFEGGSQPPKSNFVHEPKKGFVRFLQIRDFGSDKNITYIPDSKKNRYCNDEDVLLGRYGASVGKILVNKNGAYNVAVMKTIPNLDVLDKKYFYFYLISDEFQKRLNKVSARSAQAGFSKDDIYDFPVMTPTLSEQHRVVKILDEFFADVARAKVNAEKNLQNVKDLFESYLQSIFAPPSPRLRIGKEFGKDWDEKKLGEVLKKTENVDPTKKPNNEFIYIDISSVNKETKEIVYSTLLIGKNAPSRARKLIKKDDVIFSTVRPTHARVALITEEYNNQVCSTGYFVLRSKDFLNNKLVFYFLLTKGFNNQMEKLQKGASYPAVTDSEVRNIFILFPKSISEQKLIVAKLDKLSEQTKKLEEIYKKKLDNLEELKKSILKKVFSGDL